MLSTWMVHEIITKGTFRPWPTGLSKTLQNITGSSADEALERSTRAHGCMKGSRGLSPWVSARFRLLGRARLSSPAPLSNAALDGLGRIAQCLALPWL